MTKDDFDAMIEMILDEGVEITLHKEDGIRWHDLHLQMKSGMDIAYVDEVCVFKPDMIERVLLKISTA